LIDLLNPSSAIQCDGAACSAGGYNHPIDVTLSATDSGSAGVKEIRYTTDGSNPTASSSLYTGPVTIGTTTTIKWRAEDNAGNVESTKSQQVLIENTAPTTQIRCDGAPCASFYNHPVDVTLSATDAGAAGVKEIRYTTDGSDPTSSSPVYTAAIPVSADTTIKYRAEDNAGNVEAPVKSKSISIDMGAPLSDIECEGGACQSSYNHGVDVTLSATDTGGSGVKEIRYTTNGSNPTGSSPVYSGPINVDSTTTVKWRAEDNAGNVESPVHSQAIQIVPPPPNPGNQTAQFNLSSMQSMPNGSAKLVFDVNGPGSLQAVDASLAGASAIAAKKRTPKVKPGSQSVAQAGEVTLVIRASKAGKKLLRRKGKLSVSIRVTFTPANGSPVVQGIKVKLKMKPRL
jgi:hypothetical protein